MLFSILIAVMVVLGVVLIVLILLQQGKGADAGAAFGSGASGTVFGSRGSGNFLSRATGVLMALFMILAVAMAWLGQHGAVRSGSVMAAAGAAPVTASAPANAKTAPVTSSVPAAARARAAATRKASAPVPKTGEG